MPTQIQKEKTNQIADESVAQLKEKVANKCIAKNASSQEIIGDKPICNIRFSTWEGKFCKNNGEEIPIIEADKKGKFQLNNYFTCICPKTEDKMKQSVC